MNATAKTEAVQTHENIAMRAYQLWEQDGRKIGQDAKYWLQAEKELLGRSKMGNPGSREIMTARTNTAEILGTNRLAKRSRAHATR